MMMRALLLTLTCALHLASYAGEAIIRVQAPDHAGKVALLYRYDDLFTLRTVRLDQTALNDAGHATLRAEVTGTTKVRLRIGDEFADLFLRPRSDLKVLFPLPDPRTPRTLSGTTRVAIELIDLDALDINALTSDLNEKLDDFILEDLATDQVAGMQAAEIHRTEEGVVADTVSRPPTLFVIPSWSDVRVDTFEHRLRNFYRGIDDPWFLQYLEYGVASMRQGPTAKDLQLHQRYLQGREIHYDVPEQVRFIRGLYTEHLIAFALRHHEQATLSAMGMAGIDSLKAVFARHDLLRENDRLTELVALDQLYLHKAHQRLQRADVLRLIGDVAERSQYAEHRTIAANMLWDLTAMHPGGTLPAIRLQDMQGKDAGLGDLLEGPACIMVTASWCTWCDMELAGLAKLVQDHEGIIPTAIISLDPTLDDVRRHRRTVPGDPFQWFHAQAELQLREDMRIRGLPAIYLMNDGQLVHAPAPLPSTGLGAIFHRTKVEAEQGRKMKVWDD